MSTQRLHRDTKGCMHHAFANVLPTQFFCCSILQNSYVQLFTASQEELTSTDHDGEYTELAIEAASGMLSPFEQLCTEIKFMICEKLLEVKPGTRFTNGGLMRTNKHFHAFMTEVMLKRYTFVYVKLQMTPKWLDYFLNTSAKDPRSTYLGIRTTRVKELQLDQDLILSIEKFKHYSARLRITDKKAGHHQTLHIMLMGQEQLAQFCRNFAFVTSGHGEWSRPLHVKPGLKKTKLCVTLYEKSAGCYQSASSLLAPLRRYIWTPQHLSDLVVLRIKERGKPPAILPGEHLPGQRPWSNFTGLVELLSGLRSSACLADANNDLKEAVRLGLEVRDLLKIKFNVSRNHKDDILPRDRPDPQWDVLETIMFENIASTAMVLVRLAKAEPECAGYYIRLCFELMGAAQGGTTPDTSWDRTLSGALHRRPSLRACIHSILAVEASARAMCERGHDAIGLASGESLVNRCYWNIMGREAGH